ncbi:MAG: hypothetical protein PHE06_03150 [Lachnospiraceae bacterium]|nr:hypothetical protein [Lachnospiraceae bacterium]
MKRIMQKAVTVISLAGMCLSFVVCVSAAWQVSGDTDNILTMATYQNRIEEKYEIPDHVDPSQTVSKSVNVTNTGKTDTIVRVAVKKQFGRKKEDGSFEVDPALNPDMILITYNTTSWMEKGGYFYYKNILEAETTTKEPLFQSYTLSPEAGNAYKGKDAQIIVTMESVQAEGNAVSLWGTTYRDLGIEAPPAPESKATSVIYGGTENGFDITTSKTDLFANFKNLLPGCGRTQEINIANQSSEAVEIKLHAEAVNQEKMTSQKRELVNQMLNQYAVIEVAANGSVIYAGPVSGNLSGTGNSIKTDISLGQYAAGETKTLTVKLSLHPKMDNSFQKITGKVKWVFTVNGEDAEAVPQNTITPAKTGINKSLAGKLTVFLGFLVLGCVSFFRSRKGNITYHGR